MEAVGVRILFKHLPTGTEENQEKPHQDGASMGPDLDMGKVKLSLHLTN
jgi:hypothetical protein